MASPAACSSDVPREVKCLRSARPLVRTVGGVGLHRRHPASAKSSSALVTIAANEQLPTTASGRDRGGHALGRLPPQRCRPRSAARGGHGGHHQGVADRGPGRRSAAALEILRTLEAAGSACDLVSASGEKPRSNLEALVLEVERRLEESGLDLEVAVMGCIVRAGRSEEGRFRHRGRGGRGCGVRRGAPGKEGAPGTTGRRPLRRDRPPVGPRWGR